MRAEAQPDELLDRIQELNARLDEYPDERARELAQDLLGTVIAVYGDGLRRIVDAIARSRQAGATILDELAQDGVVASLLLVHDLYPETLETRVQQALDTVRPYMESHGGDVELLGIEDGVASLALEGSCNGCAASRATLELAIKQALDEHAPDLAGLRVRGLTEAPGGDGGLQLPMVKAPPGPCIAIGGDTGGDTAGDTAGETRRSRSHERCDLCTTTVAVDHRHLLQLSERRIVCVCEACWALRSGDADYRPTGTRTLWLEALEFDDDTWAAFQIPIGLAFLMRSSVTGGMVAFYPSPAGATESELNLEAWAALVALNPILADLEPDAEALVVNRLAEPPQHLIAPIDDCYALVGLIKSSWEGISGGSALKRAVPEFFEAMRARAVVPR